MYYLPTDNIPHSIRFLVSKECVPECEWREKMSKCTKGLFSKSHSYLQILFNFFSLYPNTLGFSLEFCAWIILIFDWWICYSLYIIRQNWLYMITWAQISSRRWTMITVTNTKSCVCNRMYLCVWVCVFVWVRVYEFPCVLCMPVLFCISIRVCKLEYVRIRLFRGS